jgi:O-antigen/teichoic acid export membrane protein
MADHPTDAARLSAKHLVQFFFPPAWFYSINDNSSQAVGIRQAIMWALSLFGLAGVLLVLVQGRRRFDYLVIMVLVPVLPYVITQPILRYRYITYAPMMFFGCIAVVALLGMLGHRIRQRRPQPEGVSG